jgi:myo-inositol-1(or 4)-monophosphatase
VGAGGDLTVEIDRLAESTAIDELERMAGRGARFTLLSEEVGRRSFGAPLPLVLMDPIDGSLNAKQGIPVFSIMLSLVEGDTVGNVSAGYVRNLVSGEAWHAVRGGGAYRNGAPLHPLASHDSEDSEDIELLGLESSRRAVFKARGLIERAAKVRILGSMALSLVHTAAGSLQVFCAPQPARVFDMTASLLVLRESGGIATDLEGAALDSLTVDLDRRTTIVAAADRRVHRLALQALR